MKTSLFSITTVAVLAATAAFAGPPSKTNVPPPGSAAYGSVNTAPATPAASSERTMTVKSGKRTSTVPCDGATAKCKAHCNQ